MTKIKTETPCDSRTEDGDSQGQSITIDQFEKMLKEARIPTRQDILSLCLSKDFYSVDKIRVLEKMPSEAFKETTDMEWIEEQLKSVGQKKLARYICYASNYPKFQDDEEQQMWCQDISGGAGLLSGLSIWRSRTLDLSMDTKSLQLPRSRWSNILMGVSVCCRCLTLR